VSQTERGPGDRGYHRIVQPPLLSLLVFTCKATRAASVKASLTPRFFMAEHSVRYVSRRIHVQQAHRIPRYRRALIFSATRRPSS
jgi:hypothetical protein